MGCLYNENGIKYFAWMRWK